MDLEGLRPFYRSFQNEDSESSSDNDDDISGTITKLDVYNLTKNTRPTRRSGAVHGNTRMTRRNAVFQVQNVESGPSSGVQGTTRYHRYMHLLPQSDSNEMDSIIDARDFEPKPRGTKASELMRAKAEGRLGLGHSISNLIPEFKPYKAPPPPLTYAKRTILTSAQIAESSSRLAVSPRRPSSAPVTRSASGMAVGSSSPLTPRALQSGASRDGQHWRPSSAASARSVGGTPSAAARPGSAASVRSTQSEGRRVFVGSFSSPRSDGDSPRPLRTNSASARRLMRPSPLVVPGGGGGDSEFPRGRSKLRADAESSDDEKGSGEGVRPSGGREHAQRDSDLDEHGYVDDEHSREELQRDDEESASSPQDKSERSPSERINSSGSRPASAARGRNPSAIDLSARSPARQDTLRQALADDELHSTYGSPRLKVQVW